VIFSGGEKDADLLRKTVAMHQQIGIKTLVSIGTEMWGGSVHV
jgi:hypothetical protein